MPKLTAEEIEAGCTIIRLSLEEAIKKISNLPKDIEDFARFAQLRDLEMLRVCKDGLYIVLWV